MKSKLILLLLVATQLYAQTTTYTAFLDGASVVPAPSGSSNAGAAVFQFDQATRALTGVVVHSISDPSANGYLRRGSATENLGLPSFVSWIGTGFEISITLTTTQRYLLEYGQLYVEVTSTAFPGGEIRGQLLNLYTGFANYTALQRGSGENPANASPALGVCLTRFDEATSTIYWKNVNNIANTITAAHFHGPAVPGVNAPVVVPFPTPSHVTIGSAVISSTISGHLHNVLLYCNFHSNIFPGGEIRGQVLPLSYSAPTPSFLATWTYLPNARIIRFKYRVRFSNPNPWETITVDGSVTSLFLENLIANTAYEYTMLIKNKDKTSLPPTPFQYFTT